MLARFRRPAKGALGSLLLIAHVFMAWKALSLITLSSHPIHVIISASMEPAFQRGDLIFIWNRNPLVKVGEIPVIWFEGSPLPMTHRAIKVIWSEEEAGEAE